MGFVHAIQSLSQIAWPGMFDWDSGKPKSGEGRSRAFNPAEAQTPEEALAYIRLLSKAGRTDELVGLLRRNPVFREAWQTLQQFSATGSEAGEPPAAAIPAPDPSGLPVPASGTEPASRLPIPDPDAASAQVTAASGISPKTPAAETYPVPAPRAARPLSAGLQAYTSQQRYYVEALNPQTLISLRV
jgi:hypothetical protein